MILLNEVFDKKEDRVLARDLLQKVANNFANGTSDEFVCIELERVATREYEALLISEMLGIARKIEAEIHVRIAPRYTVETWLYYQDFPEDSLTMDNMRQYRTRWVESMLAELGEE